MPYVGVSLLVSRAYTRESYSTAERVPRSWSFRYNPIIPRDLGFPLSLRESTGSIVVLRNGTRQDLVPSQMIQTI